VPVSIVPPEKAIIVSISSSKLVGGVPMTIPSDGNGYGPVNRLSNVVMSRCMRMIFTFRARCAAGMLRSCAR
jgi:hypothetical protein